MYTRHWGCTNQIYKQINPPQNDRKNISIQYSKRHSKITGAISFYSKLWYLILLQPFWDPYSCNFLLFCWICSWHEWVLTTNILMANGGKDGRDPTHIYCNVSLFLLHILQCCSLQFNTANYIIYDVLEWDRKDSTYM
jgi:hypothetical protein